MKNSKDIRELSDIYEAVVGGFSAENQIKEAIAKIQMSDVFFSKIIAGMQSYPVNGGTMSTDGKNLAYNPEFVQKLVNYGGNNSVQGVVVHEILHIAFGHHLAFAKELDEAKKTGNENLKWMVNVAADLAINDFLKGRPGFPQDLFIPGVNPNEEPFISFPPNKDARWYFNQLFDFFKKKPTPPASETPQKGNDENEQGGEDGEEDQQGGGESGDTGGDEDGNQQDGQAGNGNEAGDGSQDGQGDQSGEGGGENGDAQGGQGGQGGEEAEEGGDGAGGGQGEPKTGQSGGEGGASQSGQSGAQGHGQGKEEQQGGVKPQSGTPKPLGQEISDIPDDLIEKYKKTGEILSPSDVPPNKADQKLQEHEQDMKEFERDARKIEDAKGLRGQGNYGGAYAGIGYRQFIKDQNRIPWGQIINEFLSKNERSKQSYRRPSRRMAGMSFEDFYSGSNKEIILPSRYEQKLNELIFIVDVSGSNEDAAREIFPELKAAINSSGFGTRSSLRLVSFNVGVDDEYVFAFNPSKDYKSLKHPNEKVPEDKIIVPEGNELIGDKDLGRFKWKIGGGTVIGPVFEALNTLPEQPPFIVILTDGEFGGQDMEMLTKGNFKFKIIWIMTRDNGIQFQGYRTYNLYEMDYQQ